ncbi:MAG: agmatine deiminase family protein, partial [Planctomycetes bacterium]|nr:agmatine deiminase family protein [Planctomycetota bacterium]
MKKRAFSLSVVWVFACMTLGTLSTWAAEEPKTVPLSMQLEWERNNPDSLPIWLTSDELHRLHEIGMNFVPTAAPPGEIRQPGEFETMEGVLIRYPFGISYSIIAEMSQDVEVVNIVSNSSQQSYVNGQYVSNGVNTSNCSYLIAPSDSYWTRDYGPWFIINGNDDLGVVDTVYNRPRPNDDDIPTEYAQDQGMPVYGMNLETAGGNYMCDGQGIAVSTDLVWEENSLSHSQIDALVEDYLGITQYHVIPDCLGDYIKHIDCTAKFLAPDKVLVIQVAPGHSQYTAIEAQAAYFAGQNSCYG